MNPIQYKLYMANQYQLQDVIDKAANLKQLQTILKEFDTVVTPLNELLIQYFQDSLWSSIRIQRDNQDRDIADWQKAIKKTVDVEVKINYQAPILAQKSDTYYFYNYWLIKRESEDNKDSEFKKTSNTSIIIEIIMIEARLVNEISQAKPQVSQDKKTLILGEVRRANLLTP